MRWTWTWISYIFAQQHLSFWFDVHECSNSTEWLGMHLIGRLHFKTIPIKISWIVNWTTILNVRPVNWLSVYIYLVRPLLRCTDRKSHLQISSQLHLSVCHSFNLMAIIILEIRLYVHFDNYSLIVLCPLSASSSAIRFVWFGLLDQNLCFTHFEHVRSVFEFLPLNLFPHKSRILLTWHFSCNRDRFNPVHLHSTKSTVK